MALPVTSVVKTAELSELVFTFLSQTLSVSVASLYSAVSLFMVKSSFIAISSSAAIPLFVIMSSFTVMSSK